MMTETEKQELSRDVAAKYGIAPNRLIGYSNEFIDENWLWLHQDSARCFDLMVEHGLDCTLSVFANSVTFLNYENSSTHAEKFADHPTEQEATRIAILKALLAKD